MQLNDNIFKHLFKEDIDDLQDQIEYKQIETKFYVSPSALIGIALITAGSLTLPYFFLGTGIGALGYVISDNFIYPETRLLDKETKNSAPENMNYVNQLLNNYFHIFLYVPILEEALFRGILLPLITQAFHYLWFHEEATYSSDEQNTPLLPTPNVFNQKTKTLGLTPDTGLAIVISSILFGWMHLYNNHDLKKHQALASTFMGMLFGLSFVHFGLISCCAAHITNNFLAVTRLHWKKYHLENTLSDSAQKSINETNAPR